MGSQQDETQFRTNSGAFLSLTKPPPPLKANVLFCRFFWNLIRFWAKLKILMSCFSDILKNFIIHKEMDKHNQQTSD